MRLTKCSLQLAIGDRQAGGWQLACIEFATSSNETNNINNNSIAVQQLVAVFPRYSHIGVYENM